MARPAASDPNLTKYVADALLKKAKGGHSPEYEELKALFRECRKRVEQEPENSDAVAQLTTLLASLTANVSSIHERKHEAIVSDVLSVRLWSAPQALLLSVLDFTRNLIVANSAFTHTCLQLLVYSFTPPPAPPNPADPSTDPHGPWRPSEQSGTIHACLLSCLSRVLGLVPTAPANVLPVIVAQMPHKLRDRNTQCLYLSALFRIAEDRAGAPIREALLTAAVEHLLSLDVEIRWEDIVDVPTGEEEEEAAEETLEDIFELEGLLATELDINATPEEIEARQAMAALRGGAGGRGGWEGAVAGGAAGAAAAGAAGGVAARPPVDEMADKLDSMMELAFEHLSRRLSAGQLRQVWDTLLSSFERTILNTHRSKFTQFLLFYACLADARHCATSLVALLLARLRDPRQPPVTRSACAAYLASFLARAGFLPESLVVSTLKELASFCVSYCHENAGGLNPVGPAAGAANGGGGMSKSSSNGNIAGAAPRAQSGCGLADGTAPFVSIGGEAAESQTQRHQVLYAAVQAVLYVLCYHMGPLVGSLQQQPQQQGQVQPEAEAEALRAKQQQAAAVVGLVREQVWAVLQHPRLQPLTVCLPSVAAEFVHQAAALGVVDCRPLLAQLEPSSRSHRPLEMFFPFDPYLLRRSSRFLQLKTSYVRWRHGHPQAAAGGAAAGGDGAAGAAADDDSDSEEDEGEEADEEGAEEHGAAVVAEDGDLSTSSSDDDSDDDDEDEEGGGHSLPSDAVLHDPTRRMHHAASAQLHRPSHSHHHQHSHQSPFHGGRGLHHGGRGGGRGASSAAVMGTSYMSYASADTASVGDGGMASPYGMSPYDGGGMLVGNPLGSSPGVIPMSLGTPEVKGTYMTQVPMRIGRR